MLHRLDLWREYYDISEDAHLNLLIILQDYGINLDPSILGTNCASYPPYTEVQPPLVDQSTVRLLADNPGPFGSQQLWTEDFMPHLNHSDGVETPQGALIASTSYAQHANTRESTLTIASDRQTPCARCWIRKKKVL